MESINLSWIAWFFPLVKVQESVCGKLNSNNKFCDIANPMTITVQCTKLYRLLKSYSDKTLPLNLILYEETDISWHFLYDNK